MAVESARDLPVQRYTIYERRMSAPGNRTIGAAMGIAAMLWWLSRDRQGRASGANLPMTPATNPRNPADAVIGPAGHNIESRLDEGIEESFPASDPVSVHIE